MRGIEGPASLPGPSNLRRRGRRMLAKRSINIPRTVPPRTAQAAERTEPRAVAMSAIDGSSRVPLPASPELQAIARALSNDGERLVEQMVEMIHQIPEY